MAAADHAGDNRAPVLSERDRAAGELMHTLGLRPPAQVVWDGLNLIVETRGQVLPERPTRWAGRFPIIYRP